MRYRFPQIICQFSLGDHFLELGFCLCIESDLKTGFDTRIIVSPDSQSLNHGVVLRVVRFSASTVFPEELFIAMRSKLEQGFTAPINSTPELCVLGTANRNWARWNEHAFDIDLVKIAVRFYLFPQRLARFELILADSRVST